MLFDTFFLLLLIFFVVCNIFCFGIIEEKRTPFLSRTFFLLLVFLVHVVADVCFDNQGQTMDNIVLEKRQRVKLNKA